MQDPGTYIYVAGLMEADKKFEIAMEELAGSKEAWLDLKAKIAADGRYAELLYD